MGNPTAKGRVVKSSPTVSGASFNHGRKMIAFVAPHGTYDGNVIDHASHVGKPIRNGDPRLTIMRERAVTGDDRALHLGLVVAEANGINELTGVLIALRIECVDVADPSAHEQENHRLGFGGEMRPQHGILDFSSLGPDAAQGSPKKPPTSAMEKLASGQLPGR